MPLVYKEMSAPIAEPMTLAQAKLQCIIDSGDTSQDTVIGGYIMTSFPSLIGLAPSAQMIATSFTGNTGTRS